jgi:hypothetical protein
LATLALGSASLSVVASVYRSSDIALTETPQTFQAWLFQELQSVDVSHVDAAGNIANRLLIMPLEKRRGLAAALMQPAFWTPFAAEGQTPRAAQQVMRNGLLQALSRAPMLGDLYLAAAWLEVRIEGFGARGRALLKASHRFAPRELPFVVNRLSMAPLVWALLKDEDRALLRADLETLRRVQPERADKIEAALAKDGVTFP